MPLKSNTVEAASRTLLLLEELNRHRVTSIDRLHKATGLPKSTVVRLMKSLCAMGYAANDRRQGGYAVASRVKSLSNGFQGDPLVVEAARPWAKRLAALGISWRILGWLVALWGVLYGAQFVVIALCRVSRAPALLSQAFRAALPELRARATRSHSSRAFARDG